GRVGPQCRLACSRGVDLRAPLVDAGQRAIDASVLKGALTTVVLECGLRRVDRRGGLRDLRPIVVVFQPDELVAFPDLLVVTRDHVANEARDLRAERRQVAPAAPAA